MFCLANITIFSSLFLKYDNFYLQGFVKIARWNDINFYSIKQAVEKTHSTLMKHIRSFREVLSQPVTPILTEKPSIGPSQTPGSGDTEMRTVQDELMYSIEKFIPDDHWKVKHTEYNHSGYLGYNRTQAPPWYV